MRVEGYCYVGECDYCGKETILNKVVPLFCYKYVFVCNGCEEILK